MGTAASVGNFGTAAASNVTPFAAINNGQINPNDATNAASQLNAITATNSPYIQQATQQGYLSAAARGLGNSSIGAGASEAAAVQAAAPLAEQNASAATTGMLQNAQLQTQASEFNVSQQAAAQELQAQLQTSVSQANANAITATSQFNASQQQAADTANAAAKNQLAAQTQALTEAMNQQDLSGTQAANLARIQATSQQLIASNQSAANLYANYMTSLSATAGNQNISPQRLGETMAAMQSMLQSGLNVIDAMNGANLDITQPNVGAIAGGAYAGGANAGSVTVGGAAPAALSQKKIA